MPADEFYLGLLDDLHDLHHLKSSAYGTDTDALANFVAVAAVSGDPLWRYPRLRALEKLARVESLERQGRVDELAGEHLEAASLLLCAEALRRRRVLGPATLPLGDRGPAFAERLRELAEYVAGARSAVDYEPRVLYEIATALSRAADLLSPAAHAPSPPGGGAQMHDHAVTATERS